MCVCVCVCASVCVEYVCTFVSVRVYVYECVFGQGMLVCMSHEIQCVCSSVCVEYVLCSCVCVCMNVSACLWPEYARLHERWGCSVCVRHACSCSYTHHQHSCMNRYMYSVCVRHACSCVFMLCVGVYMCVCVMPALAATPTSSIPK